MNGENNGIHYAFKSLAGIKVKYSVKEKSLPMQVLVNWVPVEPEEEEINWQPIENITGGEENLRVFTKIIDNFKRLEKLKGTARRKMRLLVDIHFDFRDQLVAYRIKRENKDPAKQWRRIKGDRVIAEEDKDLIDEQLIGYLFSNSSRLNSRSPIIKTKLDTRMLLFLVLVVLMMTVASLFHWSAASFVRPLISFALSDEQSELIQENVHSETV